MPDSLSEPNFDSPDSLGGSMVDEDGPETGEPAPPPNPTPPVRWLRPLPEYGVILCTEHQTCYTPGSNLREHLLRKHAVKGERAKEIASWVAAQNIADQVTCPPDNSPFIHGLQFHEGWLCTAESCIYRSTSQQMLQRHCSKEHGVDARRKQRERSMYCKVMLQCFFTKATDYWIVQGGTSHAREQPVSGGTNVSLGGSSSVDSTSRRHSQPSQSVAHALTASLEHAIKEDEGRYRQLGEPNHVSEISPWLRKSAFHKHLAGLDAELIATSHLTPKSDEDDQRLYELIWSGARVLQKAYGLVPDLLHVDARVLNTFRAGTITQDPFQPLQNKSSFQNYLGVFQSLVCYYVRALERHFDKEMFVATDSQVDALTLALGVSEKLVELRSQEPEGVASDAEEEDTRTEPESQEQIDQLEPELDHHVFNFCVALIQHKLKRAYDSAIMSFLAARSSLVSREDKTITFRPEAQVAGMLSKLIYCCQLILLQDAHHIKERRGLEDIEEPLQQLCQQWLQNNTRGPVSVMDDWRLYTMHIGGAFIPEALVVWDADGKNLTYGDIRYGISDLADEISLALREAKRIFYDELCLGLPDVPTFPLVELQDNWSNNQPGYSFIKDPRNAVYFEGCQEWLIRHVGQDPALLHTVFHTEQHEFDDTASWPVRSDFAKEYEVSDEEYKEASMVLLHKGSGQPARRVEFLGIRWRNSGLAIRNLRLLFEFLCFILSYHKAQTRTHASRSPVRFVFPEVAQMLVQYLVLVQPFRIWLSQQCNIPEVVGDYLFNRGAKPWPEKRMTATLTRWSHRSLGRPVSIPKWRQIAVAIAVKYFSGLKFEGDTDIAGDDDDDIDETTRVDGITLPASFHAQIAHSGRTGNRIYGGRTINFAGRLTDAGVQAYLWTSKLWWTLFEREVRDLPGGKRIRPASMQDPSGTTSSLIKKIAYRTQARHHITWGSEDVLVALRHLFRDPQAHFRSAVQQQMVETVASRYPEVVVILQTGGGKSLAFMVPAFLPRAATTVVVMPLVVLKQDMVRRFQDANIQYSIWSGHGSSERFNGVPVVFVSAEQAVKQPFRKWIGLLDANRQLDRIVFDEAHLVLTSSSYRPKMAMLRFLRELRCQVVFLSATLPPVMMEEFSARMCLDQARVIRDITFRADIRYSIQQQPGGDETFDEWVVANVRRALAFYEAHETRARCIVYIENRETTRTLAELLGCEFYHSSSGTAPEKDQVLQRWRRGVYKVIVGTSAFGMGVDYAHVRHVFHYELPSDAINFSQEVGRIGRDGQGGVSTVLLPRHAQGMDDERWEREKNVTPLSKRVMQRYTYARCLRAVVSRYVDGPEHMQYCTDVNMRCSICRLTSEAEGFNGLFDPTVESDMTPWWDLASSQPSRDTGDMGDEGVEAEDASGDEGEGFAEIDEAAGAFEGGRQRLQEAERNSAYRLAQYIRRLRQWKGTCLICRLLNDGSPSHHDLNDCRRQSKFRFFDAKRPFAKKTKTREWMTDWTACWGCGQPPIICSDWDPQVGPAGCEFRDMVLPAAWAVYHMRNRWGETLEEFSGQAGGFEKEEDWVKWMGEEVALFGDRAVQAARMLDKVLEKLEQGEL